MTATATAPAALDHRAAHALGAGVVSAQALGLDVSDLLRHSETVTPGAVA